MGGKPIHMGRRLLADVSDDAYDGWTTFASAQGVTVASLIEAMGLALADEDAISSLVQRSPATRAVLSKARQIAAERRRR